MLSCTHIWKNVLKSCRPACILYLNYFSCAIRGDTEGSTNCEHKFCILRCGLCCHGLELQWERLWRQAYAKCCTQVNEMHISIYCKSYKLKIFFNSNVTSEGARPRSVIHKHCCVCFFKIRICQTLRGGFARTEELTVGNFEACREQWKHDLYKTQWY